MIDAEQIINHMESALEQEWNLYCQMLPLSKQQHELLKEAEPNAETIAELMEKKVGISNQLDQLAEQHKETKTAWETAISGIPEPKRLGVKIWKERLTNVIEELKDLEDEIIERIKTCEKAVNSQLKQMYQGRNAHRAYFKMEQSPPQYLDKRK